MAHSKSILGARALGIMTLGINVLLSVAFFMGMLSETSVVRPSVVLLSVMAPRTSFTFTSLARVFDGLAYKGAPPIT
jgi:hypothetical protein